MGPVIDHNPGNNVLFKLSEYIIAHHAVSNNKSPQTRLPVVCVPTQQPPNGETFNSIMVFEKIEEHYLLTQIIQW
jgi:hypothetical protein